MFPFMALREKTLPSKSTPSTLGAVCPTSGLAKTVLQALMVIRAKSRARNLCIEIGV
jgi:hypothetical protein